MIYTTSEYEKLIRREFLAASAEALPPQDVAAALEERPPRTSGLQDATERSRYRRRRQGTRPMEAATPGQDVSLRALPFTSRRRRGRKIEWGWTAGEFATYPKDIKAACRGDADAFMAACELLEHLDVRLFKQKGEILVRGVSLAQIGLALGKSESTASRAVHRLQALKVLKVFQIGKCQPNIYKFARFCNGAWTFPLGDYRSSVRRIEKQRAKLKERGDTAGQLAVSHSFGFVQQLANKLTEAVRTKDWDTVAEHERATFGDEMMGSGGRGGP